MFCDSDVSQWGGLYQHLDPGLTFYYYYKKTWV